MYKNPKKPKPKGHSAMQPSLSAHGVTLVKGEVAGLGMPVNDEKFWRRRAEDVPVDQMFFRTYFIRKDEKDRKKAEKVGKRKGKRGEEGSDSEEEDEEPEGGWSVARSEDAGDNYVAEEGEESVDGSESEDGGFDLTSVGKEPVRAGDEVEGESESDAEEAEIWKVR